jgi:hypothetical protein
MGIGKIRKGVTLTELGEEGRRHEWTISVMNGSIAGMVLV